MWPARANSLVTSTSSIAAGGDPNNTADANSGGEDPNIADANSGGEDPNTADANSGGAASTEHPQFLHRRGLPA